MTKTISQLKAELTKYKILHDHADSVASYFLNKVSAILCELEPLEQHQGFLDGKYPYDVGQKVRIKLDAVGRNLYDDFAPGCIVEVLYCSYWDDEIGRSVYCKGGSASTSVLAKYIEPL